MTLKSYLFAGLILVLPLSASAQIRCLLQVAFDSSDLSIVQLCSATKDDAGLFPLPRVASYSIKGPKDPSLPVLPRDVQVQTQGCKAEVTKDVVRLSSIQQAVQVQVSYKFPHQGKDWFVVVKNPGTSGIEYQVVTRRTTRYVPLVRPLEPYELDEEEDPQGAWTYMTLKSPLTPGSVLVVSAMSPPQKGYIGGWWLLGILLFTGAGLALWRANG